MLRRIRTALGKAETPCEHRACGSYRSQRGQRTPVGTALTWALRHLRSMVDLASNPLGKLRQAPSRPGLSFRTRNMRTESAEVLWLAGKDIRFGENGVVCGIETKAQGGRGPKMFWSSGRG